MLSVPYFKFSMTQLPSLLHRRRDIDLMFVQEHPTAAGLQLGVQRHPVTPEDQAYLFLIKGRGAAQTDDLDVFRMLPLLHSSLF